MSLSLALADFLNNLIDDSLDALRDTGPGTTARTSLCSGSKATWSHQSPLGSSAGLAGSQFLCFFRQADDRIGMDLDQASGLSDAAALGEVLEDGVRLLVGQMGMEQGRALAFGEAVRASVAVEQTDVVVLAVVGTDREISGVALAVEGAIGLLAAEASEVVHGRGSPRRSRRVGFGDGG